MAPVVGGSIPLVHPKEEDRMNLLTVMWRVAVGIGAVASVFFGLIFMIAALFLMTEKLKKMSVRGVKTRHRVVVFILGYLLLSLGVFLNSIMLL